MDAREVPLADRLQKIFEEIETLDEGKSLIVSTENLRTARSAHFTASR